MKSYHFIGGVLCVSSFAVSTVYASSSVYNDRREFKFMDDNEDSLVPKQELCDYIKEIPKLKIADDKEWENHNYDFFIPKYSENALISINKYMIELKYQKESPIIHLRSTPKDPKNTFNYIEFDVKVNFNEKVNYTLMVESNDAFLEFIINSKSFFALTEHIKDGDLFHSETKGKNLNENLLDGFNKFAMHFQPNYVRIFINGKFVGKASTIVPDPYRVEFSIESTIKGDTLPIDTLMQIKSIKVTCSKSNKISDDKGVSFPSKKLCKPRKKLI